jgi:chemotaxis protein MotB
VAVTRELVRKRVPARNLVAAGYSKYDPIAKNSSARGRERNRRIEIILEPALREVALPTAKKAKRKP